MEGAESLRRKLGVTNELRSVVRTMKSLAAVNLRQYEKSLHALAQYRRGVEIGLGVVLEGVTGPDEPVKAGGALGAIVFGSDQGLCGQFNERIAAFAAQAIRPSPPGGGEAAVVAVGERLVAPLAEAGLGIERCLPVPASAAGVTPLVHELLIQVEAWREQKRLGRIVLFHNEPAGGVAFTQCRVDLVPVDLAFVKSRPHPRASRTLPAFTMQRAQLFAALVREHLFACLLGALLRSLSSESASRFGAMQAAEKNIDEILRELRLRFHDQRQGAVTAELLDISAGFEALCPDGAGATV
jgi:F-type H+-transporting ATPase subunit gamma